MNQSGSTLHVPRLSSSIRQRDIIQIQAALSSTSFFNGSIDVIKNQAGLSFFDFLQNRALLILDEDRILLYTSGFVKLSKLVYGSI